MESRNNEIGRLESENVSLQKRLDAMSIKLAAYHGQDPHALDSLARQHEALVQTHAASADRIQTLQKNLAGWENERRKFKDVMAVETMF